MPITGVAAFQHRGFSQSLKRKVAAQLAVGLAGILTLSNVAAVEATAVCEIDRPVRFVAMDWDSNRLLLEVERFIIEQGYGCSTEVQSAEVLDGVKALEQGDVDVHSEVWLSSVSAPWQEAESSGQVKRLGELYLGGGGSFAPDAVKEAVEQAQADDELIGGCGADANCSEDPLAYPEHAVFTGLNTRFSEQTPQLSAFFANVRIEPDLMANTLKAMQASSINAEEAARQFLSENEDVWAQWLPMHVTLRVKGAL